MSYACDIDAPEFYHETFPVARKQHWCCECNAPIDVFEKHLYARGKNEGDFWHVRQHMVCRELCMLIRSVHDCICFGDLKEYFGDYGEDLIARGGNVEARSLWAKILRRERAARSAFASPEQPR